jgi:hypothetical protein
MSSVALMWAATVAPVADVQEYAILVRMADEADEAGCGVLLGTATIAADILVNAKTVQRRLDAMLERGLLGLGDQRKAAYIRADRRPVVYDLLIPATCFADLARTNARRAAKDLPPITTDSRPVQQPPPPDQRRTPRNDIGKPRVRKLVEGGDDAQPADGGTSSPPVGDPDESGTGGLLVQHGGTASPARGDYQSPDPGTTDPGSTDPGKTSSPSRTSASAHASTATETATALGDYDREHLVAACRTAAAARAGVPGWTVRQCGEAAQAALGAGHDPADVAERLVELAHDKACAFPTMLAADLAVAAARAVQAARPPAAPPWPTAGEAAPEGAVRYLDNDRPRCRTHPGQPADNCSACRIDARVAAAEARMEAERAPDSTADAA